MTSSIRFDELKRKTYLAYHEDGIADLLLGAGTFNFGVGMLRPDSSLWLVTWIFAFLYLPLKNRVTVPRLGYVRFDSRRASVVKGSLTAIMGLFFLAGIAVFAAVSGSNADLRETVYDFFPLIVGALSTAALAAAAAVVGIPRYYGYALLAALLALGAQADVWSIEEAVVAMGAILLLAGLTLVARFVRRYPVEVEEHNHGE